MGHVLKVSFLGQFELVLDDELVLSYEDIGSVKNAKLLAYLLKHHDSKMSGQELQNVMFADDSSTNPANALKAIVFRLRSVLKSRFGDLPIILSGKSGYCIHPDIDVVLDVDVFEELIQGAKVEENEELILSHFEEALKLYQGTFLPMFSSEQWVMIDSTYLESSYMTAMTYVLKEYLKHGRYEDVEELSTNALNYDNLNENLHYYLLTALMKQNKVNIAKQHYLATEKLLYDELGIYPNDDLQNIYNEIISQQRLKEATMNDVQEGLIEHRTQDGAFQCSYETFRKIYQLEARKAIRRGSGSEYLVLLTIEANELVKKNPTVIDAIIESTSSLLCQSILTSLRAGDTFTKYSNSQYLILLPDCTDENARTVVKRLTSHFYKADKYNRVTIHSKVDEIRLAGVDLK